ncbi:MAG: MarR family transcriptional regulator [Acetatifactor sp.]|nr:MarR family transcriptional regulator [Acetatifactor sp.]
MKLNPRELEVLKILHESERALTSTEIVNSGDELTQSTVQAVLRKMLAAELVEVQGVTHSGNVLSRTFGPTAKSKEVLIDKFLEDIRSFHSIIDKVDMLAGMMDLEEDGPKKDAQIDDMIKYLTGLKKKGKK